MPVSLYPARRHPLYGRSCRSEARRVDYGPGLRHRRLPRLRVRSRKNNYVQSVADHQTLQQQIHGVEKKQLPHLLATTNMLLHGIEVPVQIRHDNTLNKPLSSWDEQLDVIVTNPPFGGTEEDGIEKNFPAEMQTRETADLFLQLIVEVLAKNGRAAVVLPDGTLFGEGVKTKIKKLLTEECNLHTIVRLPNGVLTRTPGSKPTCCSLPKASRPKTSGSTSTRTRRA